MPRTIVPTASFGPIVAMENEVSGLSPADVTDVIASAGATDPNTLIIDCRPFLLFNQSRLAESINVHCPPIVKRRSGGFISLENIVPCRDRRSKLVNGSFPNILVYDESTDDLDKSSKDSNLLSVIKSLLKQVANLTIRFIIGGFDAVKEECPVLCLHPHSNFIMSNREKVHKERKQSPLQIEPAEILPHLYLGDVSHSSQRGLLERLGISALVNVSSSCVNHFEGQYQYMSLQISDTMNADLLSWFTGVIKFIDRIAADKGKVLVHCRAGVSRSATVCLAYLMQTQGWTLDAAFEYIMLRRPIIDPNLNFIQQLQKFEENLRASGVIPDPSAMTSSTTTTVTKSSILSEPVTPNPPFATTPVPPKTSASVFTFSPSDQKFFEPPEGDATPMEVVCPPSPPPPSPFILPRPPRMRRCSPPMSPSNLSQSAASPRPITPRPAHLPLLQVSSPSQPCPSATSSVAPSFPQSPLFTMIQHAGETLESFTPSPGVYGSTPKTPVDRAFTCFNGDLSCQSLSLPRELGTARQYRPFTPTSNSGGSFFASDQSLASASVPSPHTPISPLGTPLSPLPSCG